MTPPMPLLEGRGLKVVHGQSIALDVNHISVFEKEILAVIGPNGAGKTTLMLALSRLVGLSGGQVFFRGCAVDNRGDAAYRRRIALVLQEPLLLDASVFDNVAAGLRFRGVDRVELKRQVDTWLERMGIAGLRDRRAHAISGGEARRVSLARALVIKPDILFLDEPFSALDAPTRLRLMDEFHAIIRQTGITTLLVTHDRDEALLLGDRVTVMFDGQVRQDGKPQAVFSNPLDEEVARFVGVETVVMGKITTPGREGLVMVEVGGRQLEAVGDYPAGSEVLVCLRPEDVTLFVDDQGTATSARNRLAGRVTQVISMGAVARVVVDCGFEVVALITQASVRELKIEKGKTVWLAFKASAIHLIRRT